jgi:hypothetical protein
MTEINSEGRNGKQLDSTMFFAAGGFLVINVISLWIRILSDFQLSILWVAIPGIIAFSASIIGLLKLYPRISSDVPWLSRGGAGFALTASAALCAAAIWILGASVFAGGISEPPPNGILALAGIFIVSMVVAFILNAVAFLISRSSRSIGYLLLVPVASWCVMLVVGMIKGLEAGTSLDIYANGVIAAAFLSIGFLLQKRKGR